MSANTVARLKITLDALKPTVRRRIEVPFDIRRGARVDPVLGGSGLGEQPNSVTGVGW